MLLQEELARIKVQDAVQSGLRAQQIHRALQEQKLDRKSVGFHGNISAVHFKIQTNPARLQNVLLQVIAVLQF